MEIYTVDAFASKPFSGNPAAVALCEQPLETLTMQRIASELNLPITAFLSRVDNGYRLRWFTAETEIKLCGHGTLASSHVLWETGRLGIGEEAFFHTLSGMLTAERGQGGWIRLDFPASPTKNSNESTETMAHALNLSPDALSGVFGYGDKLLVELHSEVLVRELAPDFAALREIPVTGVTVTAKCESGAYDIVSRYFAPRIGIPEDPVTGSSHCGLAPYWANRLGQTKLKAFQASNRGGELLLELAGDRVKISGQAVTLMRSNFDASLLSLSV